MAVKLTKYDIIKGPVVSNKAHTLYRMQQQLVLRVHPQANKSLIKAAIKEIFNVEVASVRTLIRKKSSARATQKRHDASPSTTKEKIAYVTLAKGQSLNLFDQAGGATVAAASGRSES